MKNQIFGRVFFFAIVLLNISQGYAADITFDFNDYNNIQEAIDNANEGDTIIIPEGTYSNATGEEFPIDVNKPITLEGQGSSKPVIQGDGAHTVILISSRGVHIDGLKITDGMGSEGINQMDGGGICIFVGLSETDSVEISNCLIENNACPSNESYDGSGGGIYCGGTYCTCFEIYISNCIIRQNCVHGLGGGIMCALLSHVTIDDNTLIEDNLADDQGGGVFVDVYSYCQIADTNIVHNNCAGDPLKADWGGKGGGLACESYGVFEATNCKFENNYAEYYGGGIYSRGSIFEGEGLCDSNERFPFVLNCSINENYAGLSGGGAYVSGSAVLYFRSSELYWNDAGNDGGGVYVAGGCFMGGYVCFEPDSDSSDPNGCLLEGNESGNQGGGVFLTVNSVADFKSTTLRGNSTLYDGGAVYLDEGAWGTLNNCLVNYNNSARGNGGGFSLMSESNLELVHCLAAGNFAPQNRSGFYLYPGSTLDIQDSILWRNAGGSIEDTGGYVSVTYSLNEDGNDPANNVIDGSPDYVGWGESETINVNASLDIQEALNGFDFTLSSTSPCIGTASDGNNMGADTGVGGTAGNITAKLQLSADTHDIRGRNIIFTKGVQGQSPSSSIITNSVFGYVEDAYIQNLQITGEEIFGGIVIRENVDISNCYITDNIANADGGGIYLTDGTCNITEGQISSNESSGEGGGIYAFAGTILSVKNSSINSNKTNLNMYDGGGIYLNPDTVASITEDSNVNNNSALNGGAVYVSGILEISDANFFGNVGTEAGAIYIKDIAKVTITDSFLISNTATLPVEIIGGGGAIMCLGKAEIKNTFFKGNSAKYADAGAIFVKEPSELLCQNCRFELNSANDEAGAMRIYNDVFDAYFLECEFLENLGGHAGVVYCDPGSGAVFENCNFSNNTAKWRGGAVLLWQSNTKINQCTFSDNSGNNGGTGYMQGWDNSVLTDCIIQNSNAKLQGGAFSMVNNSYTTFNHVKIIDCNAVSYGGGFCLMNNSRPNLYEVWITNCQAAYGGGVFSTGNSNGNFNNCVFKNNEALETNTYAGGGGAYFTENARGSFSNCQFQNNYAQNDGGGIGIAGQASVEIFNSLFFENAAGNTGGGTYFYNIENTGTFTNCTFASNQADKGGGIYLEDQSIVNIDSSIIYNNSPDGIRSEVDPNVLYSCTQQMWPGPGNIVEDPNFVYGPGGDYYLSQIAAGQSIDSNCVNAGRVLASEIGLDTMTTRTDRIWDAGYVDMGYHYYGTIGDLDLNGKVDFFDFAILASQWLGAPTVPSADIAPAGGDNFVDCQDLAVLVANWLRTDYYHICDLNNSGNIDMADFSYFASQWLGVPMKRSADFMPYGGDNMVDWQDLKFFCENWLWPNF